jgi:parvulin-like peptidyl-prolyl isomerase
MPRVWSIVVSFCVVLIAATTHCGGSAPCPSSAESSPKASADACLAMASAKRQRSPNEPAKIVARHVLVQYQGAKTARVHIVRFRDEACVRAMQARDELRSGASFADVVKKYSDEPGGETRAGALGGIGRTDVVPPFGDAAFELRPGELSDVVETEFGFHVIERTE